MLCCPIRAGYALLIGLEQVPVEVVVCCLSIAQRTLILDQECRSAPLVWPLAGPGARRMSLQGQTLHRLDDGVQLNRTEMQVEVVCRSMKRSRVERHRSTDHLVLAGGVGRFLVVGASS
jgi:hypothetical protein